jgi:hypothetical protein
MFGHKFRHFSKTVIGSKPIVLRTILSGMTYRSPSSLRNPRRSRGGEAISFLLSFIRSDSEAISVEIQEIATPLQGSMARK